jgi:hypothetical protein
MIPIWILTAPPVASISAILIPTSWLLGSVVVVYLMRTVIQIGPLIALTVVLWMVSNWNQVCAVADTWRTPLILMEMVSWIVLMAAPPIPKKLLLAYVVVVMLILTRMVMVYRTVRTHVFGILPRHILQACAVVAFRIPCTLNASIYLVMKM